MSHQVLARSVVRSATITIQRLSHKDPQQDDQVPISMPTKSVPLIVGQSELVPDKPLLCFDPLDYSGFPDDIENPSQGTQHAIPTLDRVTKGTRLSVYWPEDDKYYPGIVSSKSKNGMVKISYDDGNIEELNLSKEVFQVLPPADTSNPPKSTIDLDTDPCTDDSARWKIVRILGHKQLSPHKTEFQVKWDSDEVSWLPLSIVKRSDTKLFHDYALTAHGPWAIHHRTQHKRSHVD